MDALVESVRAGHAILFWSPAIITEATKVLVWIRLSNHASPLTNAAKRDAFDFVSQWFRRMTDVFHVVEDRPPYAAQWTDTPRDEDDRPVWTAAVNARADVVVTLNLKDGPPLDADGIQSWGRIMYFDPDRLIAILKNVGDFYETGQALDRQSSQDESSTGTTDDIELASDIRAFLLGTVQIEGI